MTTWDISDQLPHLECDFNAVGLSGDPDDSCIYVFDESTLLALDLTTGTRVFLFMYEDAEKTEIVGCEATLERVKLETEGWRARPDATTWYWGPRPW